MAREITYEAEFGQNGEIAQLFRKVTDGYRVFYEEWNIGGWEETQYASDSICGYGGACTFRVSEERVKKYMSLPGNKEHIERNGLDPETGDK